MRGRNATSTIWRTVVFAGAMLASPACKKSSNTASTTPETGETATPTEDPGTATPTDPNAEVGEDPCAGQGQGDDGEDPCAGRPRGVDEDEEGGVGRGFVLS